MAQGEVRVPSAWVESVHATLAEKEKMKEAFSASFFSASVVPYAERFDAQVLVFTAIPLYFLWDIKRNSARPMTDAQT